MRISRLFGTVDVKETLRFAEYNWWSSRNVLHPFSDLRVQFMKDQVAATSFRGFQVLDVGCGGGIMTERIARMGGSVLAIDPTAEAIEVAKGHLPKSLQSKVEYRNIELEAVDQQFDIVLASEVIEHVSNPQTFIRELIEKVKPGGHVFLTTVAKTLEAWLLGIVVSEQILGIVEPGTHEFQKFIDSEELIRLCQDSGLIFMNKKGWFVDLIKFETFFTEYDRLGYLAHFVKK